MIILLMHAFSVIIVYLYIIGGGNPCAPLCRSFQKGQEVILVGALVFVKKIMHI